MAKRQVGRRWMLSFCALPAALLLIEAAPDPVPAHETRIPTRQASAEPQPRPRPAAAPALAPEALAGGARVATPPGTATLADFPVLAELAIPRWLHSGEFVWNDEGVPGGPTVVLVNLRARTLSVYRGGYEIGRSSLIYGSSDKPTPIGDFPILAKDARHRSRTYGNAPMPWMLRLTGDGVALHGSQMADDYATHGCVGLPREFAQLLFGAVKVGDRVLIRRG
jgi:hypothetical protein